MMRVRSLAAPALALAAAMLLASCAGASTAPNPGPSSAAPSASSLPTADASPAPQLIPEGSAEQNLPYFDAVNAEFLSGTNPGGRPIIDNLVAGGFDKSAMQVTADKTPRGEAVDSLQISVQLGNECLIGHIDGDGYVSTTGPALATGGCLVGTTRAIDW